MPTLLLNASFAAVEAALGRRTGVPEQPDADLLPRRLRTLPAAYGQTITPLVFAS
jgi:hypothetical protein